MKTTVNSKSLASALAKLSPAIQAKSTLPIMECVKIEVDGSSMTISATNLDMQLSATIECDTKKNGNGACCIAFGKLSRAVSAMDANIEMAHVKNTLSLSAGKTKVSYATLDAADWQEMEGLAELPPDEDVEDLAKALQAVQHAACEEKNRFVMCSVRFEKDVIASTDGRSLSMSEINIGVECVVPIDLIRAVLKGKPDSISFACSDKLALFDCGDFRVIGKLIDQPFPNWRTLIKPPNESIKINRDELISVCNRGSLAGDRIKIECGNDKILIRSWDGESKSASETSAKGIFTAGPACASDAFKMALAACREEVVELGLTEGASELLRHIVIKCGPDTHIIMQMRVEGTPGE